MDFASENILIKDQITEKITNNDYTGARVLLLETLKTFPQLENASEMLTICEILCSAKTTGTETNWYGVLQLFPLDDSTAVETQYHNLMALLEPVKNDLVGASMALKFVNDAYAVLADQVKRADFDARRKLSFFSVASICNSSTNNNNNNNNNNILVPVSTGTSRLETDIGSSSGNKRKLPDLYRFGEAQDADIGTGTSGTRINDGGHNYEIGQVWLGFNDGDKMHGRYGKIISVLPEKMRVFVNWYEPCPRSSMEKKWCDLGLPVSCGDFVVRESCEVEINENKILSDLLFSGDANDRELRIYPNKGEVWAIYKDWDFNWDKETLEKCEFELVEIIANYSEDYGVKVTYLVRIEGSTNIFQRKNCENGSELNSNSSFLIPNEKLYIFSHLVTAFWSNGTFELDSLKIPNNLSEDSSLCSTGIIIGNGTRTLDEFSEGQVWAAFTSPDFMPRSYVKIINIISGTQLQVSLLEPHPMTDEEIQWTEEELPFFCGVFHKSARTKILHISSFSHLVKCDWSAKKNYFRIFPRKGEVWAVFKNRGANLKKGEYFREQFRMVEILSEYLSEERRINVGSLTEVNGALTFFERQFCDGFRLTKWFNRTEMLGFSHRVSAFRVTGQKRPGLPDFMLHLEPSALPPPKEL